MNEIIHTSKAGIVEAREIEIMRLGKMIAQAKGLEKVGTRFRVLGLSRCNSQHTGSASHVGKPVD